MARLLFGAQGEKDTKRVKGNKNGSWKDTAKTKWNKTTSKNPRKREQYKYKGIQTPLLFSALSVSTQTEILIKRGAWI